MAFGKTIRIYLPDAQPIGLRHAEITNWTGQAIACPRSQFSALGGWPEAARPGVYLLLQKGDSGAEPSVYIGESENVYSRLISHFREKDFWSEVVIFTSKDENLTKSHIRYLECRLIELAKSAKRFSITNGNDATLGSLPRPDRDAMEEYLENLRTTLGALGFPVLEPLLVPSVLTPGATPAPADGVSQQLTFEVKGLKASGHVTNEGFLLLKGSQVTKDSTASAPPSVARIRTSLLADGTLVAEGEHLVFTKDHLISSPSAAASLVSGSSKSGNVSWTDSQGKTLQEIESQSIVQQDASGAPAADLEAAKS